MKRGALSGASHKLDPTSKCDQVKGSRRAVAAEYFAEMSAADVEHLLHQKRLQEQRAADRRAEEIAARAERRDHWRETIPDRPTIGAFPRRQRIEDPLPDEWIKEAPRRLAGIVGEMRRFCADEGRVAEVVAGIARRLEIDEELAIEAIAEGIRQSRTLKRRSRDAV